MEKEKEVSYRQCDKCQKEMRPGDQSVYVGDQFWCMQCSLDQAGELSCGLDVL